jgi:hypothetical protein
MLNPCANDDNTVQFKQVMRGVIVAFSFTKDAHEEVARIKIQDNMDIKLMTVEEILNTT